jgi:5-methylcytosine-specific restriction endonuclease McrA
LTILKTKRHILRVENRGEAMERIVLLNSDYSFLNTIDWKKAMCLMSKGKVEILHASDRVIRNAEKTWEVFIPHVLRLVKLVRSVYRTRVPFSKRNVLHRDKFICQYCGIKQKKMTIDHVYPKSRGGKTNFENCVAACKSCNNSKGNRTPSEVNMGLRKQPVQPTIMEFIQAKMIALGVDKTLREFGIY